ncbi:hypothetical protein BDN71DRAFT_1493597 [Pleurotus eryngii]|uniref:Uncharacterized protein n=1 Tax=Pleurotus eryngii TaxID=5323 RepID=A0A9P6A6N4_PLEER|nr:hypothetical protein BDN71DRAFT_1493597 [Pleurotus eryngii]
MSEAPLYKSTECAVYKDGPINHENPHCPIHVMHQLVMVWLKSKLPLSTEVFPCETCKQLRASAKEEVEPIPVWERKPDIKEPYEGLLPISSELSLLHTNCYAFRLIQRELISQITEMHCTMQAVATVLEPEQSSLAGCLLDSVKRSKHVLASSKEAMSPV